MLSGLANAARTLDVAAPTLAVDDGAPWTNAYGASQKTLAATFWLSFHGLSTFLHGIVVFLSLGATVLPIPFLAAHCALLEPDVKPIERVEMAIVEVKPPPEPVVEVVPEEVPVVAEAPKPKKVKPKAAQLESVLLSKLVAREDSAIVGLLSSSNTDVVSIFGRADDLAALEDVVVGGVVGGVEGGVQGGLYGNSIGESYGVGGLGLRGVGKGGGGTGLGTFSTGKLGAELREVTVELDGATPGDIKRLARVLKYCNVTEQLHGVVVVAAGRVKSASTSPANACVVRRVRSMGATFDVDGELPLVVTPR